MTGTFVAPAIDQRRSQRRHMARGFSLVDVLVSLAVIAVLIGLLLPTLSGVRETTRQVVCRSNVRQHGFGIALFAEAQGEQIPKSSLSDSQPHLTTLARREDGRWEGLGHLFSEEYLLTGGVFYCPSHTGSHPQSLYATRWATDAPNSAISPAEIVTNYQYRGVVRGLPTGNGNFLDKIPSRMALVVDALRTQGDFNHRIGTNVLRADLSANWYPDPSSRISQGLPAGDADPAAASKVTGAWHELDFIADPPVR